MAESGPRGGSRATDRALQIAAIDLFVVPTISFKLLYGLVIPLHGRRRATMYRLLDDTAGDAGATAGAFRFRRRSRSIATRLASSISNQRATHRRLTRLQD
jgi:threonine synthase